MKTLNDLREGKFGKVWNKEDMSRVYFNNEKYLKDFIYNYIVESENMNKEDSQKLLDFDINRVYNKKKKYIFDLTNNTLYSEAANCVALFSRYNLEAEKLNLIQGGR